MAGEEETKADELVIIRRPISGEEGGHKGGVWKIAYADFMTAMMAFFLVMWLINATDKQTLTQVATYFNPLRLTDKAPISKGMQHQSESASQANEKGAGKSKSNPQAQSQSKGEAKADAGGPKYTEEALLQDPYGTLAKLAGQAAEDQGRPGKNGDAFRDPFDPAFRREARAEKRGGAKQGTPQAGANGGPTPSAPTQKASTPDVPVGAPDPATATAPAQKAATRDVPVGAPDPGTAPTPAQKAATRDVPVGAPDPGTAPAPALKASTPDVPLAPPDPATAPAPTQKAATADTPVAQPDPAAVAQAAKGAREAGEQAAERAAAAALEAEIMRAVARPGGGALPRIEVQVTEEGLLISLTDDQDFGMFAIASAEPRPAMVVLMEKLGRVIATTPERLVVRGHTDGRPYKSGAYDNWRLSAARAHMAYFMLLRAGIDDKRFERIEGHADRNLRVPTDAEAAQNRRIEILLRKAKS